MTIALRASVPPGVTVVIDAPRPLPLAWGAWRERFTGDAPIREGFTTPEGWPLSIADVGRAIHAFYLVFDRAIHAVATLPDDAGADVRAAMIAALVGAHPTFDAATIVALADL